MVGSSASRVLAWLGFCAATGLVVGLLWVFLAPRPTLVVRDGAAFYESVGKSGIAIDMTFGLLGIAAGLLTATLVALRNKAIGLDLLGAAVVGSAIGSIIAWQLGMALVGGVNGDGTVIVPDLPNGETFVGPLEITAFGVLGIWPLTVAVALAAVLVVRASRTGTKAREAAQTYLDRQNPAR